MKKIMPVWPLAKMAGYASLGCFLVTGDIAHADDWPKFRKGLWQFERTLAFTKGGELRDERLVYNKQYQEGLTGVTHRILNNERAPTLNPAEVQQFPLKDESCTYTYYSFTCVVPKGNYFLMGYTRDNSLDSRYWGFVPDKNIVGKAFFVWMNLGNLRRIGGIQ